MDRSVVSAAAYLKAMPADRYALVEAVRRAILDHLPDGYVEILQYGMIATPCRWHFTHRATTPAGASPCPMPRWAARSAISPCI